MRARKDNQGELFKQDLLSLVNTSHPLVTLADSIDWQSFEEHFGKFYSPDTGRPSKPIRLMVALSYLKYTFDCSDEELVWSWVENPYWQYFSGERYFQHKFPIDPSLMSKWRSRIKSEGLEKLLEETIKAGLKMKVLKKSQLRKLVVDTTVQEKNISFPTDSKLCNKMRSKLVEKAKSAGIVLRQSYVRVGRKSFVMQSRYARANQFRRARREQRRLKTYLGRVVRDIERKIETEPILQKHFANDLELAKRIFSQTRKSKNKLYSLHAPEVNCIAKGKSHKKYEFGCKVGLVTTASNSFIVGSLAFEGNPYDGHTLRENLTQTMRMLKVESLEDVYVDQGYSKHGCQDIADVHPVRRGWRKKKASIRKWFARRSSIEPVIGHCKQDNRMNRNYLKGIEGDKINAILSACGFNMRKLLRKFTFALIEILHNLIIRIINKPVIASPA